MDRALQAKDELNKYKHLLKSDLFLSHFGVSIVWDDLQAEFDDSLFFDDKHSFAITFISIFD